MDKSSILINKPFGYIYKISIPTSNGIRYYIGKRESPKLDTKYWGSGIKIQKWIQKHTNFKYKS